MNTEKIVCIYHKDCVDGTAAAAIVLKKFPEAHCFALSHSYKEPDISSILETIDTETRAYLVDCTLGVQELLKRDISVTIIDHHIGARDDISELATIHSGLTYVFDNEKSGASLTWDYFFGNSEIPELIAYIEDVDLWRWRYGDTSKHVNNYLSLLRNQPDALVPLIDASTDQIVEKGKVITAYTDQEIADQITRSPIGLHIGKHVIPAYNITIHESVCGNMLSEQQDKAVALYVIKGSEVKLSFRSKEHHNPSSLQLATLLGGGGHTNAAGATVSFQAFLEMIEAEK